MRAVVVRGDDGGGAHGDGVGVVLAKAPIEGQLEEEYRSHKEVLDAYAEAKDLRLESTADMQDAAGVVNDIRDRKRKIEAIMRSVTEPLQEALNNVRAWFRPTITAADDARTVWDQKIIAFNREQEASRKAGRVALSTALKSGDEAAARQAINMVQPQEKVDGIGTYQVWDFEEQNHALVPPEYTALDTGAVRREMNAQVKAGTTMPVVPGVRFFKVDRVRGTGA